MMQVDDLSVAVERLMRAVTERNLRDESRAMKR